MKQEKEYILILTKTDVKRLQAMLADAYEYNKSRDDWTRAWEAKHLEEMAKDYRLIPFNSRVRKSDEDDED